jgi:hypothetical protein
MPLFQQDAGSRPAVCLEMKQTTSNRGVVAVKQLHMLAKVAVVASSLLLVGGFVSYRAGAFNALIGPSTQPAEPAGPQQLLPATTQTVPTMMSSSKSMTLGNNVYDVQIGPYSPPNTPPPAPSQQAPPATTKAAPTIMYGSKAPYSLIETAHDKPTAPPPAPSQQVPPATTKAALDPPPAPAPAVNQPSKPAP